MRRSDHIPLPSRPCPSTAVFYILSSSEYPFRALDVVTCRTVGLNKHFMNDIPALDTACTSLLHVVAVALVAADGRVFLQQRHPEKPMRTEDRRVGNECVRKCRSGSSPDP